MKTVTIHKNEANQRLDKYLKKYLPQAPSGFFYKMLRKKNITLNTKKADGSEKLEEGDSITFFLAEETMEKFRSLENVQPYQAAFAQWEKVLPIVFENEHILILNKPSGILSQKSSDTDRSVNEFLIGYLLAKGEVTPKELETFKPSVCNRLDRNTSGMIICGKSLIGLQTMSELLKNRSLHKYYRCIVEGILKNTQTLEGYLIKDETTNKVSVANEKDAADASYIRTTYTPMKTGKNATLLEVELITGKTHQIRAHLASIGHPIIGDFKYGKRQTNELYKNKFALQSQLLHAYRLEFPVLNDPLSELSNQAFTVNPPAIFEKVMES